MTPLPAPKRTGTVLVIDDDPGVRLVLAEMLRIGGFKALTAEDGPEGIALYSQHPVVAVITDVRMPLMNGGEVVATLRKMNPDVRVIAITGWVDGTIHPFGGNLVTLRKPMTMSSLFAALDQVLAD